MALKLRKPTGLVPYPFILIEGEQKAGKTYSGAELAASGRCGEVYWIDIGEADADRYGAMADYMIIEHDGTYRDILNEVKQLKDLPAEVNGKPTLVIVDSMSGLWSMLKSRAQKASKGSTITMRQWNQVKNDWKAIADELIRFEGIVIATARGGWSVVVKNGKPTTDRTWKVDSHKSLPFDVDAWMRVSRDNPPLIVGCRSLKVKIRPGVDQPMAMHDFTMEKLIWDVLGVTDKAGKRALPDAPQEAMQSAGADEWHDLDNQLTAALADIGIKGDELQSLQSYIADKCGIESWEDTTITHLKGALKRLDDDGEPWARECVNGGVTV